jgi:hypothetical protein
MLSITYVPYLYQRVKVYEARAKGQVKLFTYLHTHFIHSYCAILSICHNMVED